MSELGTSDNPIRVRLKTMERASAAVAFCHSFGWRTIAGIEADLPEYLEDIDKLLVQHPVRQDGTKVNKNDPCPCGSDKKFKRCCREKPERLARRLEKEGRPPLITHAEEAMALLGYLEQ